MAPRCRIVFPTEERTEHRPDGAVVRTTVSPWGELTAVTRGGHPVRHRVQTIEDLRRLRHICEHARCDESPDHGATFARLDASVGDGGSPR